MAEKSKMEYYDDKPCRFIYATTGPKRVAKTLRSSRYEPRVTVFSMCRPVKDHLSLADTGRVLYEQRRLRRYDVLSAFSMTYNTRIPKSPPKLARPLAQLPPHPEILKRRRYWAKVTVAPAAEVGKLNVTQEMQPSHEPQQISPHRIEAPAAEVDKQTMSGYEPQMKTEQTMSGYKPQVKTGQMPPGHETQQSSPDRQNITQEEREAYDDMVELFRKKRNAAAVKVSYNLLKKNTQAYLNRLSS